MLSKASPTIRQDILHGLDKLIQKGSNVDVTVQVRTEIAFPKEYKPPTVYDANEEQGEFIENNELFIKQKIKNLF